LSPFYFPYISPFVNYSPLLLKLQLLLKPVSYKVRVVNDTTLNLQLLLKPMRQISLRSVAGASGRPESSLPPSQVDLDQLEKRSRSAP
jgi:hypothetical protein